ncbi:hypothetical protein [Streptomyces rochei]|uniref:hypothetical protein n=1 Tax=Streptomyces rochei TaxID=1928 RepID=UPI0033D3BD85
MGYEIDFLPVGDESSGGDAITLRYGNLHGPREQQTVMVIDGGYLDDGEALVQHIRDYYRTGVVDLVVSTHPDRDHINGLRVVLEQMTVKKLLMHLPWSHSAAIARAIARHRAQWRSQHRPLLRANSARRTHPIATTADSIRPVNARQSQRWSVGTAGQRPAACGVAVGGIGLP